ncbi:MAG: heavy-metal-associated domain-containing protein [Thermomicrobiales bacterium]|nr:heavy-metal-associated domain-containing protein [Thermomicrobiales bacterium]
MSASERSVYKVKGMSCDHCRSSVLEEVQEIDGVLSVDLDLESGRLEVEGPAVTEKQIRSAVEIAGYVLEEENA